MTASYSSASIERIISIFGQVISKLHIRHGIDKDHKLILYIET